MEKDIVILHTTCPICGKEATLDYKPFCSKKCADIDLGRWLKGSYVMHTNEEPTAEDWANASDSDNVD